MSIFVILILVGMFGATFMMQLVHYEAEDQIDPSVIRHGRRTTLAALALSLLWSLEYAYTKHWQPWPPMLMVVFCIDVLIVIKIAAIFARTKRTGPYFTSPRYQDMVKGMGDKTATLR